MSSSAPAVTAARVLILLAGIGGVLWGLFGVVGGIAALQWAPTIDNDPDLALSASDAGPFGIATMGEAGGWLLVCGVLLLVLAVVDFVLFGRLGRGERRARSLLTGLEVADLVLTLVMVATDVTFVGTLVVGLIWKALVLGLLWLPDSSRRFFGDDPPAGHGPVLTPAQVVLPWASGPPAPSSGDRWADERRAHVAAFCMQCGHPNPARGDYCGMCGTRLRLGEPTRAR